MEEGFYFLMCNYGKPGTRDNLNFEALLQFTDKEIYRYTCGDTVEKSTRFYFLFPSLEKQIIKRDAKAEEDLKSLLCKFPDLNTRSECEFLYHKTFLNAGEYYPYIYRPFLSYDFIEQKRNLPERNDLKHMLLEDMHMFDDKEYLARLNQLELLTEDLQTIFQVIEPDPSNYKVFGHKIRNLIILACTEVDSMCKNILTANIYRKKERYSTIDFVNLKNILKLEEYRVSLISHPCIVNITPFVKWNIKQPTVSLKWYNAYNAIKHDRIINQRESTLENAINAVCAVAILLVAQYGMSNNYWRNKMQKFFEISGPVWKYEDLYVPHVWNTDYIEKKYDFKKYQTSIGPASN